MLVDRCFRRSSGSVTGAALLIGLGLVSLAACGGESWPPDPSRIEPTSDVLAPEEALRAFYLPPGFHVELVASEPLVEDPVAVDFDEDGRMFVAEMRSYMPDLDAEGEMQPVGRISVLEDEDGDGRMDRSTVFLDSLVLPRAVKAIEGGVLIGAPPNLIFARDHDGDLVADEHIVVSEGYGSTRSNPEHNANGLVWGLDNCLHNSQHGQVYCAEEGAEGKLIREGRIASTATLFRGQWGVSTDDLGRLYRNFNEDPLRVDLVPAVYFARNPDLVRTRGAYENLVRDKTIWPVRPTRGVNRGYRDAVLREDGTLASFTAAGSPVVYRGGAYPSEGDGEVFVTEPAGNLVRRFVLREEGGKLRARNAYDGAEFLTSSDERFRPVNLYSGPDGALYIVDMYRGVIQHTTYLTDYLQRHIRENNLEEPIGLGRIYRVVHESMGTSERPRLSGASSAELVSHLDHSNGWWRDTAQRLLVERRDSSVAPRLRELARNAEDAVTRLRALWTLDGLGRIDENDLIAAMADGSPFVRAAAIRLAEPLLAAPATGAMPGNRATPTRGATAATDASPTTSAVPATGAMPATSATAATRAAQAIVTALEGLERDNEAVVRRQLAATYGTLPWPRRREALQRVLATDPRDSVLTDLVVSGLYGYEDEFLHDLADPRDSVFADAVAMLMGAHANGAGSEAAQRVVSDADARSAPDWFRDALQRGIEMGAPQSDPGLHESPLAAVDSTRLAAGKSLFEDVCGVCHQRDGTGMEGVAPGLVGSRWVTGATDRLIRIILDGKEGEQLMPPLQDLNDDEIADVLTYIRQSWGHGASPVASDQVDMVREITSDRNSPWTEDELLEIE